MRFRFVGRYTNGHTAINACGVIFTGHEPAEVDGAEAIRRLSGSPEFEAVADESVETPEETKPKPKRGRPKKEAS